MKTKRYIAVISCTLNRIQRRMTFAKACIMAAAMLMLASCITDDSTIGQDKAFITISGINAAYDVVTFNQEPLVIQPEVSSSYAADDLEYNWSFYNTTESLKRHTEEFKATPICDTKDLNKDMGLSDGNYTFIFTVRAKSTGYSVSQTTQVYASSLLSRGFCILKEDADGNTDVDIYNTVQQRLIPDMFATYQGAAIPGAPRAMDVIFSQAYMDTETDTPTSANLLCLTTHADEVRWVSLQGLTTVMDQYNCHYDVVEGEVPYRTVQGSWSAYFLTSNGVYSSYTGKQRVAGIFGTLSGNGGSTHIVCSPSSNYQMVYWNEQTRSLCYLDFNGNERPLTSEMADYPVKDTNYDCLFGGLCMAGGEKIFFVLQDRDNADRRLLYFIKCKTASAELERVEVIDPSTHFAQAQLYAVSSSGSMGATVAYCVHNNKVYTYALEGSGLEEELTFEGLPAEEPITYISNRYYYGLGFMFNYLAIGTQTADQYTLRLYNILGDAPDGEPAMTLNGHGRLKSYTYIDPEMTDEMACLSVPILDN